MRPHALLSLFSSFALLCPLGSAQDVVSAQSGVIHYSEGVVLVDGVPLDRKPASFPLLKDGSVLKTQKGRAELMLTQGAFLRLDENSSVKMLSSALTSTRLEFLAGSIILDALAAEGNIPVVLQFKDASISFPKPGLYRIDSDTAVLQAYSGEATVKQQDKQTPVDSSRLYFFELATDTKKFSDGTDDEFLDWARNRNQVITEENQAAQADEQSEADADLGGTPLYNYNVPYGGLGATPGFPGLGNIYPYDTFFYNSYAPSAFWMLPPFPGPTLIIGRPFAYRAVSPRWPHSGTWSSRHIAANQSWLASRPVRIYTHPTYTRPATTLSRPTYIHPAVVPRAAPHIGRR